MDQLLERPVDRRVDAELLEVASEHLHVARLVEDLAGKAELRLHLRDHVHELRAQRERGLLAEEELGVR
jgi:hypothetical protein